MKKKEAKLKKENHRILLYYMYVSILDTETFRKWQLELCKNLNLKGRIIVATEGINGTVEGTVGNTKAYMKEMKLDARFKDIHWKTSEGDGDCFPRLSVKVKPELVNLGLGEDDLDPREITGHHVKPEEFHKWLKDGEDLVMIDMRNDYEYNVGHFEGAVDPGTANFRELPDVMKELEKYKNKGKKVVTMCTGGVRCEKASGYLKKKGFEDVYQLDGGIVSYMEKYPGEHFKGSLFVFDKRQTMHFNNPETHEPITNCNHCDKPSDFMCNCADGSCNKKYVGCTDCVAVHNERLCKECEKKGVIV